MRRIKLFDSHVQTTSEEFRSLIKTILLFTKYTVSKVDNPVNWMVVTETGKYLNCFTEVLSCRFELIKQHKILSKIAITDSIVYVILSHLFLT